MNLGDGSGCLPDTSRRRRLRLGGAVCAALAAAPLWLAGCRGEQTFEAEYLFVDHLSSAVAEQASRRPLSAPRIELVHDQRIAIYQEPPSEYHFAAVPSGPDARLVIAPGMDAKSWVSPTDGVGFEARCLAADGGWQTLVELTVAPASDPDDRKWHDSEASLAQCAEPSTTIALRTSCGPADNCAADWAAWGGPRIVYKRRVEPRIPRLVLLISVDTLRPDRLSLYGAERDTSPELSRLAADGIVFETTVASSPWTIPSHATLLTSTYPQVHRASAQAPIAESIPLVSQVLGEAGWQSAGFVDTPYLGEQYGFDRGFDHYDDDAPPKGDFRRGMRVTRQRLLDWLVTADERPAFIFWHIMDVHGPYGAPAPFGGRYRAGVTAAEDSAEVSDTRLSDLQKLRYHDYLRLDRFASFDDLVAAYDEGIAATDSMVGGLFEVLRHLDLYDDALIVVTSDHGESFLDHDVWVGHGLFLTDDEIRVPLIVKLPGNRHAGLRVVDMVRQLDVVPSILDVLGLAAPASYQGQSLLSPAPGEPASLPQTAFGSSNNVGAAFVRTNAVKYITAAEMDPATLLERTLKPVEGVSVPVAPSLQEQLYHLRRDPGETTSLIGLEEPEKIEPLRALVAQHAANSAARHDGTEAEDATLQLTQEAQERLRALGYLD